MTEHPLTTCLWFDTQAEEAARFYTGIFAKENGGGFLTDYFPDAYKVIWDFSGQTATSRHIPGVSFTGIVHPGLMGTAPSADLLARWNRREGALIATDPDASGRGCSRRRLGTNPCVLARGDLRRQPRGPSVR